VAVVDGSSGALAGVQLTDVVGPPSAIAVAPDDASVAMSLTGVGNSGGRWRLTDGQHLWSQRCDGDGQAVDELDGRVYSGFHEACAGDTTIRLTANDSATGVRDMTFLPAFDRFWGVRSIDAAPTALAVAGDFTSVSGVPAQGFVLFPPVAVVAPTTTTTEPTTTTAPATTPPAPGLPLPAGSSWRYHDGADAVPGTWASPAFDDQSWASGPAQLGYGDGDERTVLSYGPDPSNKTRTAYFRGTVAVSAVPTNLRLELVADDGAAVYVNGVEVLRDNLPAGAIGPTTLAASNRSGASENAARQFTVPATALHTGTNVIAVEVHQDAPNSSDLSFDLAVSAG